MPDPVKTAAPPPNRATRKRERTRAAILDATRRLCAASGHTNLTVADIAAAADVGVGTVYYHFATKDHVLIALMQQFVGRMAAAIEEQRAQFADPIARLRASFAISLNLSRDEQELLRVYYSSAAARASFAEVARAFFLNNAMETIREGQAAGLFRPGPPALLATWLIGATAEVLQYLMTHGDMLERVTVDDLAGLMLGGLTGVPTPPG